MIPDDWDDCTIGNLFVFKNGLNKAKSFFGTGTPIVNYMDVFERSALTSDDVAGRVDLTADEISNYQVRRGDVFFTRTSETVEDIGVASVMLDDPCDTVFSGFVLRARPRDSRLNDTYKKYCFAARAVRSQIVSKATYTTRALTNGRSLSAVSIAVPPKPEQRAIAAVLSDVDELIGFLEALIAKKRAIKQGATQQLLTGRTRMPGFGGEWGAVRARDIGRFGGGSGFPLRYQGKAQGDYPFFKVSDMNRDENEILLTESRNFITEHTRQLLGAVAFPPKSIAFAKVGAAVFLERKRILAKPSCLDNNMAAFTIAEDKADTLFVYHLLSSIRFSAFASTTALPSLSGVALSNIRLSLPPLPEQQAIATVLSDMDAEIAALEQRLDKTRAIKQGMMQQLLTGTIRLPIPNDDTEGDHAYDA